MKKFAQIDDTNTIINIIEIADENAVDEDDGIKFCKLLHGEDTEWKDVTSQFDEEHNVAIGHIYDSDLDRFIPVKPYSNWIYIWHDNIFVPPIPKPDDTVEGVYVWNQDTTSWDFQAWPTE